MSAQHHLQHHAPVPPRHPWTRYVAIGDSFTEGIGDPEPHSPGGFRGWSDRVAEVLSDGTPDFAYANLAIRGRLLDQIFAEQLEPAVELRPDLVSVSAGGNDILRPGTDPDAVALRFEAGLARLTESGATVVMFTGPDVGATPLLGRIRGKVAIFNENLRTLAARYDAIVADMWSLRELVGDSRMWAPDRLHLSPIGHHTVARMVLAALAVPNELEPAHPEPLPGQTWRQARRGDAEWAREYFGPWILRRLRHESSGDGVTAKRPVPGRVRED